MKNMIGKLVYAFSLSLFSFLICFPSHGQNVSIEVQENIDQLIRTNSCVKCDLSGADLNRMNLSGADLRDSDLTNTTFFLADLSGANLSGAVLNGSQFGGADLAEADLRGADLRGAQMSGSYLGGALLDGSPTEAITLEEGVTKPLAQTPQLSPQETDENQVVIGKRMDFNPVPPTLTPSGKNKPVEDMMVTDSDAPPIKTVALIDEPILTDSLVTQTPNTPTDSTLEISKSQEENPEPPTISASPAKLKRAQFIPELASQSKTQPDSSLGSSADQQESSASYASDEVSQKAGEIVSETEEEDGLDEADVRLPVEENEPKDQPMSAATSPEEISAVANEAAVETIQPSASVGNPREMELVESSQNSRAEPEASDPQLLLKKLKRDKACYKCNFAGFDLSGVNLDGADLEGTNFSEAKLEEADFEDANLKGASFKNANLKRARFTRADLYKADFTGADLTEATFKDAALDETIFVNTIGYTAHPERPKK